MEMAESPNHPLKRPSLLRTFDDASINKLRSSSDVVPRVHPFDAFVSEQRIVVPLTDPMNGEGE